MIFWNQLPRICRNLKKKKKKKNVQNKSKNKQTKKSNLGPKVPYLGILGCKFEKGLIYLKSAS